MNLPSTSLRKTNWIGVVSDTHGHLQNTQQALRKLQSFEVHAVLHCGDIGSSQIPPLFRPWPTHYVLGNVDQPGRRLLDAIHDAGGTCHGRFGSLTLGGRKVALLHGDDLPLLDATIQSGDWELICHGHTHQANQYREGGTLVLNPGALYRAWPLSIAIVELSGMQATSIPID